MEKPKKSKPSQKPTFRELGPRDATAWHEFVAHANSPWVSLHDCLCSMRGCVEDKRIVGLLDEKIVCHGLMCLVRKPGSKKYATFTAVVVREEYRQQGVGTYLFEELIAIAKRHECPYAEVFVSKNNIAAINLCKKVGFEYINLPPSVTNMRLQLKSKIDKVVN